MTARSNSPQVIRHPRRANGESLCQYFTDAREMKLGNCRKEAIKDYIFHFHCPRGASVLSADMLRHVVMFTFADGLDKAATAATISTGRVSALTLRIFTQPSCAIHRELCRLQLLRARRVNAPVRRVNAVLRMREPLKSHSTANTILIVFTHPGLHSCRASFPM